MVFNMGNSFYDGGSCYYLTYDGVAISYTYLSQQRRDL